METNFKTWKTNRENLASFIENYSLEQFNKIPTGFSNNLVWNLGHIISVQQRLIYSLSGLPMQISNDLADLYKPGTKPNEFTSQEEVDMLKSLISSTVSQSISDIENGKFVSFKEINTSNGFNLSNLNEAVAFNNYHEGVHFGLMMNIRKFI